MTVNLLTPRDQFDKFAFLGYKLIRLNKNLIPIDRGYTDPQFVYETEYKDGQWYGLVGGSIHSDKEGKIGKLCFVDFDVKKEVKGKKEIIKEAKEQLESIKPIFMPRDYYHATTKTGGSHMGILVSENIGQGVILYSHQDCQNLRIDTRTEKGYVVAIAENYHIENIPETFDRVITDFESFMFSLGFAETKLKKKNSKKSNVFKDGLETGSRNTELFKQACTFFDQGQMEYQTGLDTCKLINQASDSPLSDDEFHRTISSAWDKVKKKDENEAKSFNNKQWDDVAHHIKENDNFVTVRETKEMWMYDESQGVYIPNADTYIEEKAQALIYKCNTKSRNEIKNTIKASQTMILAGDFFDSKIINTESGVIDPNTFNVLPHSPDYLTTTKLPFKVNMKANNFKLWKHIVHNIIEPKDSKLFLEILWVLISWKNPHKKCIIFKGLSDTQKTTLMEIISWIIGSKNIAVIKPQKFLVSGDRFSMSKFIGKRTNFSEEINNLTPDMLENLKAMIGGMVQETELKNSNDGREFDPKRFLFIFSTNFLDSIYQRIDDNSMINRFQFMKFKHIVKKKKGDWDKDFFKDEDDKTTAIETIVRLMLSWKKGGKEIQWDEAWQTKEILRAEQPIEDKYFESGRIIQKRGGKMTLDEVKRDFEKYCNYSITNQNLGYIMKEKGFESKHSGLTTYYQGYSLAEISKNETLV